MLRHNYTQLEQGSEEFQSIYNLHELLISMALPTIPSIQSKSLTAEGIQELFNLPGEPLEEKFPAFTATDDFVKVLNASFEHFGNLFEGV